MIRVNVNEGKGKKETKEKIQRVPISRISDVFSLDHMKKESLTPFPSSA
jgi:hypothetical protein